MRQGINNLFLLPVLIAALGLMLAGRVTAQTFTTLYNFSAAPYGTNSDGANPWGGLVLLGNTLFGTANSGGSSNNGTVFAVKTDGTDFTTVHTFTAAGPYGVNADGAIPGGLVQSDNTLYGTAFLGGATGSGTVFSVSTNGTGFTTIHSFWLCRFYNDPNEDGLNPSCALVLSGDTLYGTASNEERPWYDSGRGTVFTVKTNSTGTGCPYGTDF